MPKMLWESSPRIVPVAATFAPDWVVDCVALLRLLVLAQLAEALSRMAPEGIVKVAAADPVSPQPTLMLPLVADIGKLAKAGGGGTAALAGAGAAGAEAADEGSVGGVVALMGVVGERKAATLGSRTLLIRA